jgi:hypothetical protein
VKLAVAVVLCGLFAWAPIYALVSGEYDLSDGERATNVVVAVAFSAFTVLGAALVVALPYRARTRPAVAMDRFGVWWVIEQRATLVPWHQIHAVGIGYMLGPRIAVVRPRKNFALEVFPRDPGLPGRPEGAPLRFWWLTEEAPRAGVPPTRLRYVMPVAMPRRGFERLTKHYAPHTWIGVYRRAWKPIGSVMGR